MLTGECFYYVLIIVLGVIFIIHGSGNFIGFGYKTDTHTQYITNQTTNFNQKSSDAYNQKITSVTDSKNTNINYFALVEIIIGLIFLFKAVGISRVISLKLDPEIGDKPDKSDKPDDKTI
ncbi:MAG TPA: hypothetical protein PK938_01425 [Bacteroidaceae bacterium]|nr:hypothetical protein [Bacteroidaceae bacterium]